VYHFINRRRKHTKQTSIPPPNTTQTNRHTTDKHAHTSNPNHNNSHKDTHKGQTGSPGQSRQTTARAKDTQLSLPLISTGEQGKLRCAGEAPEPKLLTSHGQGCR
jgi:hypothetical protein